ncbi:hypothetical protein B0H10DRAFT_2027902 [Mycena sp. CBHHK59/15]|nr:hypothetical protein B0H10DRAFT_2027902 [Mycena sp. CBHHK59/15]
MSSSHYSPEGSTSSPSPIAAPRPLMLPSVSMSTITDLDVEDFSGRFSRRSSSDSDSDAKAKEPNSTAARRASHNAVERQRRDKLNARILELASLLPNLAGVRRPSRIAITKSSIAHIHSSRKHRMLASQQLRALHAETESLRTEVNHWRRRAGIPGVMEPRRGNAFMVVLTGAELELDPIDVGEEEEAEDSGMLYSRPPPMHARTLSHPQSGSPFGYGVSPPSSSSSSTFSSSPYSSPPSSADFRLPASAWAPTSKLDMVPEHEPRIACPTPANPFEAQHFMLQAEDEWAVYGAPATHFHDLTSW